jgi:hypothetical protein
MSCSLLVGRRALATVALLHIAVAFPSRAPAQEHPATGQRRDQPRIPESLRIEHREIQEALTRATRVKGRVGAAARELVAVLHPHFVREEQIALPPLGLLAPLSRGEATPTMRAVLPMTDSLRAELPRMLDEHRAIRAATVKLGEAARAERNTVVVRLTEQLKLHAQSEEELFYPAAVLVGDLVRSRSIVGARP